MIRWALRGLLIYVLSMAVISVSALRYADPIEAVPEGRVAEVMVLLGGGMERDGRIGSESESRARFAAALYAKGLAPEIIVTGGNSRRHHRSVAQAMAEVMIEAGVPSSAIRIEGQSLSTIQNALMSRPMADGRAILLVTEGTHMARSVLTFWWAGYDIASLRATSGMEGLYDRIGVGREALAWGFNITRVVGWHILGLFGWTDADRMALMA